MKKAIDKVLNNFVFSDIEVLRHKIYIHNTPLVNEKNVEVEVFISPDYSEKTVEDIANKIETSLKMLGVTSVWVNYTYVESKKPMTVIRAFGDIKLK